MNYRKAYLLAGLGSAALAAITLGLSSCVSLPKGAKAVRPFDKEKYLGTWYEIARLDFKYEKELEQVSATYSLREVGKIRVDNKGFQAKEQRWKESIGKAKPAAAPDEGRLKVSFFGPFYAGYNIIGLDPEYRYALVAGNNLKYLWLLSREKTMPESIKNRYLRQARALGYDTDQLVWTNQLP
jgi:apolipoprotein D and lipocalin family protein